MMSPQDTDRQRILFCSCVHYAIIPAATKERVLAALTSAGNVQVEMVADLCGLAAQRDPRLKTWVDEVPLTIVACFPRAIRWLFHRAGALLPDGNARIFNMRTQSPEEIIADCGLQITDSNQTVHPHSEISNPQSDWVPWFPVLDYDRCRNCKQCLNFCLFGVYSLSDEGRVEVQKPSGCKTNCPACARMCPQKAIIFPKYTESPINGEDVIADCGLQIADSSRDANPQSNDLYDRIRRRGPGHQRFSRQSNEAPCPTIEGLRKELGVPDDVFVSLSPAELQQIAAKTRGDTGQSPAKADRKDGGHDE